VFAHGTRICLLFFTIDSLFIHFQDGEHGLFGDKNTWHSKVYIDDRRLVEAVVGSKSPLAGMKADDSVRQAYNAFVVAVHRHGVPLLFQDGLVLESGDSVLLLTTDSFMSKYGRDSTFALIRRVANFKQRRHKYAPVLGSVALVLMIVLSQVLNEPQYSNISILKTALCGMIFMAITGCASQVEMRYFDLLFLLSLCGESTAP
jgi:hypothetical protein